MVVGSVEIMKGKIKNTTLSEQLQNLIVKWWKEETWIPLTYTYITAITGPFDTIYFSSTMH
jgi:hypothetical protein